MDGTDQDEDIDSARPDMNMLIDVIMDLNGHKHRLRHDIDIHVGKGPE